MKHLGRSVRRLAAALAVGAVLAGTAALGATAQAAEPIKIGFGMALSGALAGNGKAALIAIEMWAEDVNKKGGLLGRPVQLVYYDDQTNPALVPGIYTKLLDVDKVDLVISGYGTNVQAPAMPVVMQHGMVFMGLFGLAVNDQFHYDRFFQIQPSGPNPRIATAKGYFDVAMAMEPKPRTLAIAGADAEYPKVSMEGVRELAKQHGLKVVYDRSYPPNTVDFAPIVRAIQATSPDLVFVASYPPDTAGMINAAAEIGLKTKVFGGGMIGLQYASLKQQFGAKLNGILCYDLYAPVPTMNFPGVKEFLARYQSQAAAQGADALGYYLPPFAYAAMQIVGEAVEKTKGLDQQKIAQYIHGTTFSTVIGDVKFGADGEWAEPRTIFLQYQGIKGNDLEQFKKAETAVVLYPPQFKSGTFKFPYSEIQH